MDIYLWGEHTNKLVKEKEGKEKEQDMHKYLWTLKAYSLTQKFYFYKLVHMHLYMHRYLKMHL